MDKKKDKLAIYFPGIGYHKDKPLLYYSSRLLQTYGYQNLFVDRSSSQVCDGKHG